MTEQDLEIGPPPVKRGCIYLEWKDIAPEPEEMPQMAMFCKQLRQFLPDKLQRKEGSICAKCVLYRGKP
jgi:hypothetical protein